MSGARKPTGTAKTEKKHDQIVIDEFIQKVMSGVSRLECAVCGRVNGFDNYLVRNAVWKEAALKRSDFCCLDCLSERLGRDLSVDDFDSRTPLNRPLIFGYLMARKELRKPGGRARVLESDAVLPGLPRLSGKRRT